jgi:hypothetical protein
METYRLLAKTISLRFPLTLVHCLSDHPTSLISKPLHRYAKFHEYVVVDGKRYHASRAVGSNKLSLVQVRIPSTPPVDAYGEILEIFEVIQEFQHIKRPLVMAHTRWFKSWAGEPESIWHAL